MSAAARASQQEDEFDTIFPQVRFVMQARVVFFGGEQ